MALGTGKTAKPAQAQEIPALFRAEVAEKYGKEVAENCSILYGGSCKPSNAKELFANPDVDGGLIGGAALKAADFKGIIDAFNSLGEGRRMKNGEYTFLILLLLFLRNSVV